MAEAAPAWREPCSGPPPSRKRDAGHGEREAWELAHRNELDRLNALDSTIERRAHLAGRAAEIDRPPHIVAILGVPPTDREGRARWRTAAAAVESYAARWDEPPDVRGDALDTFTAAQAEQLAEVRSAIEGLATLDTARVEPAVELA